MGGRRWSQMVLLGLFLSLNLFCFSSLRAGKPDFLWSIPMEAVVLPDTLASDSAVREEGKAWSNVLFDVKVKPYVPKKKKTARREAVSCIILSVAI